MRRRIVPVESFHESFAALGSAEETMCIAEALLRRATIRPEEAPMLPGVRIRVLRSRSYGPFPPLRLFYWVSEEAVHLLEIEWYDELSD